MRAGFSCLRGGGAAFKLVGRARLAALVVVGLGFMEERSTGGRLLAWRPTMVCRFSCRIYCKPGWRVCRSLTRAGARCLLGVGAGLKHAARSPRHAGCVYLRLINSAAPAEEFSPSMCGHGATCQRSPPTPAAAREASAHALALAVSGEVVQHASFLRARAPRWSALVLTDSATPPGDSFSSSRGRGAAYQLPLPSPSRRTREKQVHARWL